MRACGCRHPRLPPPHLATASATPVTSYDAITGPPSWPGGRPWRAVVLYSRRNEKASAVRLWNLAGRSTARVSGREGGEGRRDGERVHDRQSKGDKGTGICLLQPLALLAATQARAASAQLQHGPLT
jgi:hypothetical protein